MNDTTNRTRTGAGPELARVAPSVDRRWAEAFVVEQRLLDETLRVTRGNKTLTAKLLGIDVRTVSRKLERRDEAEEAAPG